MPSRSIPSRKPVPSTASTEKKPANLTDPALEKYIEHKGPKAKAKGKDIEGPTAFGLLPKEIIQQILSIADPGTFDALTLVNSRWREASRSSWIYAHQLKRCGIVDLPPVNSHEESLRNLIRLFSAVARRELFETALNLRVTEIQLIYSAASSAAAVPGGEAFRFRFSPKGTTLLALSSSRIFVINLAGRLPVVLRELKVRKRPAAAAILDDGSILAVLSADHNVTLYDLRAEKARFMRSFPLENEPRTIALSPGAEVLGAAYDGGIEVYSLLEGSSPTDRRSVNCDTVDSLEFSLDGTFLVGTAMNSESPVTVLVSAQHFSIDMPVEGLAQLWTTQVLFPRSSRDSSHASLLPTAEDDEEVAWTFAYDRVYQTFRAVRVEDLRNGHTYFTGPSDNETGAIPPTTLPASSRDGTIIAAGFRGGRIWLYGIPKRLDKPTPPLSSEIPHTDCSTPERTPSNGSRMVPQWQVLSERLRNVFVRGREITQLPGLLGLRFINSRLIAVAGGGVTIMDESEERPVSAGGGRIFIYDFSSARRPAAHTDRPETIIIEVGDGIQGPVETLQEINRTIESEVDIARRRTVRRAPTTATPRTRPETEARQSTISAEDPYAHNVPRASTTMQRAATVARPADPMRYARVVGPDGQPLPENHRENTGPILQDNWEPPPPPYTPNNDNPVPLPPHVLATLNPPPPAQGQTHPQPQQNAVPQRSRTAIGSLMRPWISRSSNANTMPVTPVEVERPFVHPIRITTHPSPSLLTLPPAMSSNPHLPNTPVADIYPPRSESAFAMRPVTMNFPTLQHFDDDDLDLASGRQSQPIAPRFPIRRPVSSFTSNPSSSAFGSTSHHMPPVPPIPDQFISSSLDPQPVQTSSMLHDARQVQVAPQPPPSHIPSIPQEGTRATTTRRVTRVASVRRRASRAERNGTVRRLRRGTNAVGAAGIVEREGTTRQSSRSGKCILM